MKSNINKRNARFEFQLNNNERASARARANRTRERGYANWPLFFLLWFIACVAPGDWNSMLLGKITFMSTTEHNKTVNSGAINWLRFVLLLYSVIKRTIGWWRDIRSFYFIIFLDAFNCVSSIVSKTEMQNGFGRKNKNGNRRVCTQLRFNKMIVWL